MRYIYLMINHITPLLLFIGLVWAETKTVAISYFDNTSGLEQYNPLSKGLADMLITDLSNVKSIQIVEREKLESLLKEIDLGEGKFIDPNTAQKLGKGLGAGYMLTGSYLIMGETMRIDARLVDVGTGEIAMAEEITGEKNTFFELEKDLVNKLIVTLNLELSRAETRKIKKVQTESFESFSAYSSGLDAFDNGEYDKAMKSLEEAVEIDEGFDIAWDKLDELEKNLADFMKTRSLGLSMEVIDEIDKLSKGDKSYCDSYNSKNWQIYGNLVGAAGWGIHLLDESLYEDVKLELSKNTLWTNFGFKKAPVTYEEFCVEFGKMLNQAFASWEYLFSKNLSDDPCGVFSPNESALAAICFLLSSLSNTFGELDKSPDVLDKDGKVLIPSDQYDKLLIKYGSDYIRRFPYSFYVSSVEPMVQAAIDREKSKIDP